MAHPHDIINLWMGFDDRARPNALPDQANENAHRAFNSLADPISPSLYRVDNPNGPRDYELWSMYFQDIDEAGILQIRNDFNADFPGQVRTIGAWWCDGRQVGQEWVYGDVTRDVNDPAYNQTDVPNPDYQPDPELPDYDPNETIPDPDWVAPDPWPQIQVTTNEIIGTSGDPVFPLHVRILEFIPDIVTYDVDGNEISRVRPTVESDVNLIMGQAPRRFT